MDSSHDAVDLSLMEEVFARYKGQKGALIPILQKAQSIYGYLPPQILQSIADELGISLGKVYAVATFYAQFYLEKRGKHTLRVCDGTACHVKGAPALMDVVEQEFGVGPGETSADGELSEEIVYCLGSCALAPAAVLDGQVMGRLRPEGLVPRLRRSIREASSGEHLGPGGGDGHT
jgi:NADH-quinone oxidoreductase subunit E